MLAFAQLHIQRSHKQYTYTQLVTTHIHTNIHIRKKIHSTCTEKYALTYIQIHPQSALLHTKIQTHIRYTLAQATTHSHTDMLTQTHTYTQIPYSHTHT